jgi:uncharacterized protein (TIGR02147 family)
VELEAVKSIVKPKIEDYECYRKFLSDYYYFNKGQFSGFTFRRFSQLSGFKSPNFIQLVIKGERNLTHDSAKKIGKGLKLSNGEQIIFDSLVKEAHAKNNKEAQEARASRLRGLRRIFTKKIKSDKIKILNKWYYMAVREVVSLHDFVLDAEFVSECLLGLITTDQARESLDLLISEGYIKQDESGRWVQSDIVLDAESDNIKTELIRKFHEDTLKFWSHALASLSPNLRNTSCLTMSVSRETAALIKEKMRDFEDEIIGLVGQENKAEIIIQMGTYLIPFDDS